MNMKNNIIFNWSEQKNSLLKETRKVSFEEVVIAIERGDLLEVVSNHSKNHKEQNCLVVLINNYAHLVPYVDDATGIF